MRDIKYRIRNLEIYYNYKCGESVAFLSHKYGISRQRIYGIIKEIDKGKNDKKFINALDTRTRNCLLRSGFPKDGDKKTLWDMIERGDLIATWRNAGEKTLETIGLIVGHKVKLELVGKETTYYRNFSLETIKRRLVFDFDEIESDKWEELCDGQEN